jgi:hypothetical protein
MAWRPYAALQQWQAAIIFFFFFLLDSFKKEKKGKKTCFSTLVIGLTQAASCNVDSFRQQQHQHPPATIALVAPVALALATITFFKKNSRTYKQQRSVASNMKHRK